VTPRKYLVLVGVTIFASIGDSLLAHGMQLSGSVSLNHLSRIFWMVANPWIVLGILFLLAFFACYMMALSWADLTYVLPATSLGYVLLALIARFILHEHVSMARWVGILFISAGVGFVTQGPALTHHPHAPAEEQAEEAVTSGVER